MVVAAVVVLVIGLDLCFRFGGRGDCRGGVFGCCLCMVGWIDGKDGWMDGWM